MDLFNSKEKQDEVTEAVEEMTEAVENTVEEATDEPVFAAEVPRNLLEKYSDLDSVYYTIDYAELEDGTWKVIEAGDGSVSGLSESQETEEYYRTLYYCLNED